jgi:sortase A
MSMGLVPDLRTTPRRLRRAAGVVLLVIGLLLVAEGVVTLAWREPLSAITARDEQAKLSAELARRESAALAAPAGFVKRRAGDGTAVAALRYRRDASRGEPLGRIEIPAIDERFVFVSGVSARELKKGPGHYPETALPGEHGTVGIAAHRTTYVAPFRNIDRLERGDPIVIRMPYGEFRYRVEGRMVVSPSNTRSLRGVRHDRLALTTCHPPFSAAKRMVVTAALASTKVNKRAPEARS